MSGPNDNKVKLSWARAEEHVIFNLVMHWSRAARRQQLGKISRISSQLLGVLSFQSFGSLGS